MLSGALLIITTAAGLTNSYCRHFSLVYGPEREGRGTVSPFLNKQYVRAGPYAALPSTLKYVTCKMVRALLLFLTITFWGVAADLQAQGTLSGGKNLSVIRNLIAGGVLTESENRVYVFSQDNPNVDAFAILKLVFDVRPELMQETPDSIVNFLNFYGLNGPTMLSVAKKFTTVGKELNPEERWSALFWAVMKDMLSQKATRNTFIENLKEKAIITPGLQEASIRFIEGEISLEDFLLTSPNLVKPVTAVAVSQREIQSFLKNLLDQVLQNDYGDFTVTRTGSELSINFADRSYQFSSTDLAYPRHPDEETSGDLITFSDYSYQFIARVLSQIAIDNDKPFQYLHISPKEFFTNYDQDEFSHFDLIRQLFPEVPSFTGAYLIKCNPDSEVYVLNKVAMSFPSAPFSPDHQLAIKNFLPEGTVTNNPSVKSEVKESFFSFLQNEAHTLGMSPSAIEKVVAENRWRRLYSPDQLMRELNDLKIKFSGYPNYGKNLPISPPKDSFPQVFPRHIYFLKHDFPASNVTFDESTDTFLFEYKKEMYRVKAQPLDVFKKVMSLLKQDGLLAYGLYAFVEEASPHETFYRLTAKNKQQLESILGVVLYEVPLE